MQSTIQSIRPNPSALLPGVQPLGLLLYPGTERTLYFHATGGLIAYMLARSRVTFDLRTGIMWRLISISVPERRGQ